MNISEYKLVVSDLDGTLVKSGSSQLSTAIKKTIAVLQAQGVIFTIATGRSWSQTKPIVQELAIQAPVIIQTGAIIIDPLTDQLIKTWPFIPKLAAKIRQIELDPSLDCFCLSQTGTYYTTNVNTDSGIWLLENEQVTQVTNLENIPALNLLIKKLYVGPEQPLRELAKRIVTNIKPTPNLIYWPPVPEGSDAFLEVFDHSASKGQALKWLTKYFRFKSAQTIAFGDGYNDYDMLQWAGLGVVMENAPSEIIAKVKLKIPGPEQDGIARFLNGELLLNHPFKGFSFNLPK